MDLFILIAKALIEGIPDVIKALRDGKRSYDITLGDFVSMDALAEIEKATAKAEDYISNG